MLGIPSQDLLPAAIVAALLLLTAFTAPRRRRRRRSGAGALAQWAWRRRLVRDDAASRAGRAGERMVARAVAKSRLPVLHDIYLPVGEDVTQVDHVVLAGSCLVVIETKHMAGMVFGREGDETWTQVRQDRKRRFRNPHMQNRVHVAAVSQAIGGALPVVGIVVFSAGATLRIATASPTMRLGDLLPFLSRAAGDGRRTSRGDKAWSSLQRAASSIPRHVAMSRHAATLAKASNRVS